MGISGEIFKMRFIASPMIAISHCTALRKQMSSQNTLNSFGRDEQNNSILDIERRMSLRDLRIELSIDQLFCAVEFGAEYLIFDSSFVYEVYFAS